MVRVREKWRGETNGNKYENFLYLALLGIALALPFLRVSEMAMEGGGCSGGSFLRGGWIASRLWCCWYCIQLCCFRCCC